MKNDNHVWDNKLPTAQMLGRWQPWHAGHQKLFEEILKKTGQVNIMVRDVKGVEDNPFDFGTVKKNIFEALKDYKNKEFYKKGNDKLIRNYGIGAQIIKDLKIKNMILITKSPKKVIGLEGYDIKITKQEIMK